MAINRTEYLIEYSFPELENALQTEYTITIRNACNILHASRQWVNDFVRPFVHYVCVKPCQARLLGVSESIFLSMNDFRQLILNNLTFSRRTIRISLDQLLDQKTRNQVLAKCKQLDLQIAQVSTQKMPACAEQLRMKKDKIILQNLTDSAKELYGSKPNAQRRTLYNAIPCRCYVELSQLETIASMKRPGDYDEIIFRQLFNKGAIRCELNLPSKDGLISQKIYYYVEPAPPHPITVSYEDYLLFLAAANNSASTYDKESPLGLVRLGGEEVG